MTLRHKVCYGLIMSCVGVLHTAGGCSRETDDVIPPFFGILDIRTLHGGGDLLLDLTGCEPEFFISYMKDKNSSREFVVIRPAAVACLEPWEHRLFVQERTTLGGMREYYLHIPTARRVYFVDDGRALREVGDERFYSEVKQHLRSPDPTSLYESKAWKNTLVPMIERYRRVYPEL